VAKKTLKNYAAVDVPTEHIPTRRVAALAKYGAQLEALRA
jgi:hypothetical protein